MLFNRKIFFSRKGAGIVKFFYHSFQGSDCFYHGFCFSDLSGTATLNDIDWFLSARVAP